MSDVDWGTMGEWAGAMVTAGALVFAWVQLRREKHETAEALEQGRIAVAAAVEQAATAQGQLQLAREQWAAQREAERRRHADEVEAHFGIDGNGTTFVVECRNHGSRAISNVEWLALFIGAHTRDGRFDFVDAGTTKTDRIKLTTPLRREDVLEVHVVFSDVNDVKWSRSAITGHLAEGDSNVHFRTVAMRRILGRT